MYTMIQRWVTSPGFKLSKSNSKHKLSALSVFQKAYLVLHQQSSIDIEKCSETLQTYVLYAIF